MRLENLRRYMELRGGGDVWSLHGNVYGHPAEKFIDGDEIQTSCPVFLDRKKRILRTRSGSIYHLGVCASNEEDVFNQIERDIKNGGYEIH